MAIEDSIRTISGTLYPDSRYMLSSYFNANGTAILEDCEKFPIIILDNELSKKKEIKKNINIGENTRIRIYILTPDTPDNTGDQTNTIRQETELMADRLAVNIYQLPEVFPEENQKYETKPLFHVMGSDLTGTQLDINAIVNKTINFCTE